MGLELRICDSSCWETLPLLVLTVDGTQKYVVFQEAGSMPNYVVYRVCMKVQQKALKTSEKRDD